MKVHYRANFIKNDLKIIIVEKRKIEVFENVKCLGKDVIDKLIETYLSENSSLLKISILCLNGQLQVHSLSQMSLPIILLNINKVSH